MWTALTDRCAKKVKLFRTVFFELPTGDSTISSENTGIFRQMGHGNAINRLSENLTFFAQRSVSLGTSSKVAIDGPFEAVLGKTRRTEF